MKYVPDGYKTQQMCDKAIFKKWWNSRICSLLLQKSTVDNYPHVLKLCDKAVNRCFLTFIYIPD